MIFKTFFSILPARTCLPKYLNLSSHWQIDNWNQKDSDFSSPNLIHHALEPYWLMAAMIFPSLWRGLRKA